MNRTNKTRLNLYLNKDTIDFAKKWSHVTNVSISRMLEEYLQDRQKVVESTTPFQWVSDKTFAVPLSGEEQELKDLEEYLDNQEEERFCTRNPTHPRAKVRRRLTREHEKLFREQRVKQKQLEKELVQRWMETFTMDEPD